MPVNSGGLPVVRPYPLYLSTTGLGVILPQSKGLFLQSDHHIGSAMTDYGLIKEELDAVKKRNDRVILGGDLFDSIFPSDRRRYRPEAVHSRLRGRSDMQNEAIAWAEEIFAPYADHIDGIAIGNHEQDAIQKHHLDSVAELVRRLNTRLEGRYKIAQLGWSSIIEYRVIAGHKNLNPFVIYFHHGTGKTASAHRALRTLYEKSIGFEADLYWSGHTHAVAQTAELQMRVQNGVLVPRPVRHVLTGSYMLAYQNQPQESMEHGGRKSNYAVEAGYLPHALGGARVVLTWRNLSLPPRVEVTQ